MKRLRIINVVGARPNFIKIAPIVWEIEKRSKEIEYMIVHTGQHYDHEMSQTFFDELHIPPPHINLNAGSDTHAKQVAKIMIKLEDVLLNYKPDLVLVVGDVNSTLAGALVAAKLGIKIAHVEAGLRSFNKKMPEEINRKLTDAISDLLFTTEESANINLKKEGIPPEMIFFVGNVMIDTLKSFLKKLDNSLPFSELKIKDYGVVTLHRPCNVNFPEVLSDLLDTFIEISKKIRLVIPLHPRTLNNIRKFGLIDKINILKQKGAIVSTPLSYTQMIRLVKNSRFVITDSGGLQEETTYLGIPCITIRKVTERPSTVEIGTNVIVGKDKKLIFQYLEDIFENRFKKGSIPPLWDGNTAKRILDVITTIR